MPTASPALSVSAVIGNKIQATDGTDLGVIKELIIDPNTGQIILAVFSADPSESTGELLSVPWNALKSTHANGIFYLDSESFSESPEDGQDQDGDDTTPIIAYTTSVYKPRET